MTITDPEKLKTKHTCGFGPVSVTFHFKPFFNLIENPVSRCFKENLKRNLYHATENNLSVHL